MGGGYGSQDTLRGSTPAARRFSSATGESSPRVARPCSSTYKPSLPVRRDLATNLKLQLLAHQLSALQPVLADSTLEFLSARTRRLEISLLWAAVRSSWT